MKKTLFILSVVLLGFSSCIIEGPEGPPGINGQNGLNGGGAFTKIIDVRVNQNDWIYNNDGGFYSYTANISFIDQYIYDYAVVSVYIDYGASQAILPLVRPYETTDIYGSPYFYTTTTDFEYGVGEMTFFVTNSDFFKERPDGRLFRVAFVWEE